MNAGKTISPCDEDERKRRSTRTVGCPVKARSAEGSSGSSSRLSWPVARLRSLLREARDDESAQAAVEYALMTSYLLVVVLLGTPFLMAFAPEMLNALQIYMDGFYFSLALPIP